VKRALVFAVALAAGRAMAEEIEIFVDKAHPVGSLTRVVEPAYPKALLSAGKGGHVDITGTVSPLGDLENVRYTPDSPASQAFVEPLREVVPYWKFRSNVDDECRPVAQAVTTRMFFEVVEGKPKVSVTHAKGEKARPELRASKRVQPEFPRRAAERQHEAMVYAATEITPDGKVASVQAWSYPTHNSATLFKDATRTALMQWEFPPASAERKRRLCYDLDFKLTN
jgi:outer membrane biosynthesis protein TonB